MSVEDRLILLLVQARESGGEAALGDISALRSRLVTRAPDLHGEIQALTAALAGGIPGRIAASPDPLAERAAAAAQIARDERLSIAVVNPALNVACHAAADFAARGHVPGGDSWAGDSMVVGSPAPTPGPGYAPPPHQAPPFAPPGLPPHFPAGFPNPQGFAAPGHPFLNAPQGHGGPHYPPAREADPWNSYDISGRSQPFYTRVWFFLAIGLVIVGGAVLYTQWNNLFGRAPATATAGTGRPAPAPPTTPPPPPAAETLFTPGGTVLSRTDDGPFISLQQAPDGRRGLSFSVESDDGRLDGMLVLPASWDGEGTLVGTNAAGARSVGTGRFTLTTSNQRPVRTMQVQWRQDGVGAGPTAVAVVGAVGASEVAATGVTFCLVNRITGEPVACGQAR